MVQSMVIQPYTEGTIHYRRSEDWSVEIQFVDSTGTPIDFTGFTFSMTIRPMVGGAITYELNTANGRIASTDLPNGKITPTIADAAISAGSYVWELVGIDGSSNRESLIYGREVGDFLAVEGIDLA